MRYKIEYESYFTNELKSHVVDATTQEDAVAKIQHFFPGIKFSQIKTVTPAEPVKPPSARDITKQRNFQLDNDIIGVLSDGQPHCLRDIGQAVGYEYLTALSARVRALRKRLPEGRVLKLYKVGTYEESTWYVLKTVDAIEIAS